MSFPNIDDLSNAYVLCTCLDGGECSRACTVCRSPSWSHEGCVKALWHKHCETYPHAQPPVPLSEVIPNVKYVGIIEQPPHIPTFDAFPHSQRSDAIEKWIDLMDEEVGLEPWQAELVRWILGGGGRVELRTWRRP